MALKINNFTYIINEHHKATENLLLYIIYWARKRILLYFQNSILRRRGSNVSHSMFFRSPSESPRSTITAAQFLFFPPPLWHPTARTTSLTAPHMSLWSPPFTVLQNPDHHPHYSATVPPFLLTTAATYQTLASLPPWQPHPAATPQYLAAGGPTSPSWVCIPQALTVRSGSYSRMHTILFSCPVALVAPPQREPHNIRPFWRSADSPPSYYTWTHFGRPPVLQSLSTAYIT